MMNWATALDVQLAIFEHHDSKFGEDFAIGYFRSAQVSSSGPDAEWANADRAGRKWNSFLRLSAFNAEPIYVDPDMMTVLEAAVQAFQPEPLLPVDLITANGLLVLPRPMAYTDTQGRTISWRYALWNCSESVLIVALYHDPSDDDDFPNFGTHSPLPTMTASWRFGSNLYDEAEEANVMYRKTSDDHAESLEVQRQVQGVWRLLTQHLADRITVRAPRQGRKRARKLEREHITIVRLRRPAQPLPEDHVPSVVHWSHRWLVGGHWRNQPYPSIGISRQIWISPYVKGPEELPLVVNKTRVFTLVR